MTTGIQNNYVNKDELHTLLNTNAQAPGLRLCSKIALVAASVFLWLGGCTLLALQVLILSNKCDAIEMLCDSAYRSLVPLFGTACMVGGSITASFLCTCKVKVKCANC